MRSPDSNHNYYCKWTLQKNTSGTWPTDVATSTTLPHLVHHWLPLPLPFLPLPPRPPRLRFAAVAVCCSWTSALPVALVKLAGCDAALAKEATSLDSVMLASCSFSSCCN